MTWVVDENLEKYIAGSGSVSQFLSGGNVAFLDSEQNLLSVHSITSIQVTDTLVQAEFAPSTVGENGDNSTAAIALLRSAGNAVGYSTDSIGDSDADVLFESGQHTGWNHNTAVSGGTVSINISMTATRGT